ncbi:MAG: hypothetical protein E5X19_31545, partial [Mesorhizobium sp.]
SVLGAFRSLPHAPFVALLRRVALGAFGGAIITGALLFSVKAGTYAAMPIFLAKITLILLAGANFLAFTRLTRTSGVAESAGGIAAVLAVISLGLWTCVLFAGRFIGFL